VVFVVMRILFLICLTAVCSARIIRDHDGVLVAEDEKCTAAGGVCQTEKCTGIHLPKLCLGIPSCCVTSRMESIPDNPTEHVAIWYHGQQPPACPPNTGAVGCGCDHLKREVLYLDDERHDIITPISPGNYGGSTGTSANGVCFDWTDSDDPWPDDDPRRPTFNPTPKVFTVSGHSRGRNALFRHVQKHGEGVDRVVLLDPSYEEGRYGDQTTPISSRPIGMQVIADWLKGNQNRKFFYLYGGATTDQCCGLANFEKTFGKGGVNDALRAQIRMRFVPIEHLDFPGVFNHCLYVDDGCGDPLD